MTKKENAQTRYANKCKTYAIKFYPAEKSESDRLAYYLKESEQTANSYFKALIKADLDKKGVPYPDNTDG